MKKTFSLELVLSLGFGIVLLGMTAVSLPGLASADERPATEAFTFVQLCDPQLGMGGYDQDVIRFEQAVRIINALNVDFSVICGDLVHNFSDKSVADFLQIRSGLTMPCYLAPGNHDVGNTPTVSSLERYRAAMGRDYFSVEHKGYTFVIANTSLWRAEVPGESATHDSWFKQALTTARDSNSPAFVVQHHPVSDLPTANELLALFETSGVVAVLTGHRHTTTIEDYKGIQLVGGETTSNNFDGRPFGFRLWHVDSPTSITHEFIPLTLTIPAPDINGDGIVDAADMCIMVDHWGTADPLCDIAPMPWRDGKVDVNDLIVLAEHLFEKVQDPTLVAHWALDETEGSAAHDNVSGNDDIVIGDAIWQPIGGQVDGALRLDGIDDYVIAGPVLKPAYGPFSALVWIKGGAPGHVIISETDGPVWLSLDPLTGHLMTELTSGGRHGGPLLSQAVINDGIWHRIGFVWDGLRRILYVDGGAVAEDTQGDLQSLGGGLYIGCGNPTQPSTFFSGLIDDVRIYSRPVKP